MDRKDDDCTHAQRREQTTHSEPQKKLLPNLQENQTLISINLDEEDCEHAHAIGGCDHTQNPCQETLNPTSMRSTTLCKIVQRIGGEIPTILSQILDAWNMANMDVESEVLRSKRRIVKTEFVQPSSGSSELKLFCLLAGR
jgi:hypothetical protein